MNQWATRDDLIRRARQIGGAARDIYSPRARDAAWLDARQALFEELGDHLSAAAYEAARAAFLDEFRRADPEGGGRQP
jgi:hypothetical protein